MAPWRRGLAWAVDFALMVLLAVGLGYLTYERIVSPWSGVAREGREGFRELLTSGVDFGGEAAELASEVWGEVAGLVIQGFIALIAIQFLYQFIALSWTGRTLGKALLDMRVMPETSDAESGRLGKGAAAKRAAITTLTDTGLFSVACCLLLSGWFVPSVLCWLLAVLAFWGNALPALGRRRQSLADRAAKTAVSPAGAYRAVATGVTQGGQAAAARIAQGARGLSEHERVQQVWESQQAQQLRQAGQAAAGRIAQGARGLSEHERVQQVWESQQAQQLRQAGQGAAERGRKVLNRFKKTGQQQPGQLPDGSDPFTAGNFAQPPPGHQAAPPQGAMPHPQVPPGPPPQGTTPYPPQQVPPVAPPQAAAPYPPPQAPAGPPAPPVMPPAREPAPYQPPPVPPAQEPPQPPPQ